MIIHKEKTQEYYKSNIYCHCTDCNNFYIQFKKIRPDICEYLESLGVNPLRPFELMPNLLEDGTISYVCQYVIFGECSEDVISSIGGTDITVCRKFHPQTDIDEEHFVIDFGPLVFDDYSLKIEEFIRMIDNYNHISGKKNYAVLIEKFYAIIDYIENLQKIGLIETENVTINKCYINSIFEEDIGKTIRFKDLITKNVYVISVFPRSCPGVNIENEKNKKSFFDLIRYEKEEMNPIRFRINYIFVPIWLAIFFLNILLIVLIDAKNDNLSLISYILLGIDVLSLPVTLSILPIIRKKEVKLEMDKYDFISNAGELVYEFEDKTSVHSNNVIEFGNEYILINNKELEYEDCNCMVVTSNHLLRITVNVLFEIWDESGYEYNIPIRLDGKLIKVIDDKKIKVLNREKYDFIIHNKENAFYQIIKYGYVKKIK